MFIKLKNKRSGFVLYEAVVSLMITIMTLGILQQSLQILHNVQKTTFRDQLRWHITQEKLQELLGKSQITGVFGNRLFYKDENDKTKAIKMFGNYGRAILAIENADNGGYEPMMTNLNDINIEKKDKLVIITTENKAGQTSQMCLINDP
ncbi:ComGF family competence protein [Companilactobacillus muriivasis]|uniref:ComGF family competence protein n=1 Tax=Companilactobacillus muriivasis TaxID=3081444 RepID=UPI0030C736AB